MVPHCDSPRGWIDVEVRHFTTLEKSNAISIQDPSTLAHEWEGWPKKVILLIKWIQGQQYSIPPRVNTPKKQGDVITRKSENVVRKDLKVAYHIFQIKIAVTQPNNMYCQIHESMLYSIWANDDIFWSVNEQFSAGSPCENHPWWWGWQVSLSFKYT